MKIMITGAGGFIGKNLLERLKDKYTIVAPRSSELNLTDYLAVEKYLTQNKVTHIVHAAVHSGLRVSREDGFQNDLRMLVSLTRNLDKVEKLIVFGSGAEYAKTRDIQKVKEEQWGVYIPNDLYGFSKFLTTEIARREPKMLNLRLFGVYGPYEDYRYKFISNAIVKNLLGLPITIKQDVVFDYLYVTDLVPVVEHFLTHESKYRDYNVSTTKSIKLSEIVEIINKISDHKSKIYLLDSKLNFEYTANNEQCLNEVIGWKITNYHDGIKKIYNYYLSIKDTLNRKAIEDDIYLQKAKAKN